MRSSKRITALCSVALFFACQTAGDSGFTIDYEKYTLDNGLQVVLHVDRSDPVVAVAVTYHVGSAREVEGRTGFAHMFEHLLFQNSENVGEGGLDLLMQSVGGSSPNGSTSRDRTNYYEVFPNDALEKVLWAESDRMGFFINTVTEPNFEREKQIVKNEKRQGVDNQPYGHTNYVVDTNLYPPDHPYHWQVIGSLEDLQNATLDDVKDFYDKWYGPNSATLVIAGDFDVNETKGFVEKYFGEIKSSGVIPALEARAVEIKETKKFFHEDNFARLPRITMTWLTVEQYHPDYWALNVLGQLLSGNKKAPFYKVLVEEKKLTSNVSSFNRSSQLSGKFTISINGFPGTDLDDILDGIVDAFEKFETDGIQDKDLVRIKARQETRFYSGITTVLSKAFQLAQYNIFAGDPGFIEKDIENIMNVTKEDVMRVYETHIKDKHYIATSFVPKGEVDLALDGSAKAEVVEEKIVTGAEEEIVYTGQEQVQKTPSAFDRSVQPPLGSEPALTLPEVWTGELSNGMRLFGIKSSEVPLVRFTIRLKGGLFLDDPDKIGVANFVANMMTEGTKNRTPEDLEEAIDVLGASIFVSASGQYLTLSGTTLSRNFEKTIDLVEEIILEPRWDETEFDIIKQRILNTIRQRSANPNSIATNVFNKILYGKEHILSNSTLGTLSSVESITLDDLKNYYERNCSPSVVSMHVVGDIDRSRVTAALSGLDTRWQSKEVEFPEYSLPEGISRSRLYFVDVPDAKQSVIRIGYLALSQKDDDYYPASVLNYKLGGGFTSLLNQTLRERKGYTYGANSRFSGTTIAGPFSVSTGVRSNVTYESVDIITGILDSYGPGFSESDLEDTKNYLIKSNARAFENLNSLVGMLQNISSYDFPHDYIKQRENIVRNMTTTRVKELAAQYLDRNRMVYVIVGDAATQLGRLDMLGLGKPVLLDREANVIR